MRRSLASIQAARNQFYYLYAASAAVMRRPSQVPIRMDVWVTCRMFVTVEQANTAELLWKEEKSEEPVSEERLATPSTSLYPEALLEEYRALAQKKRIRILTEQDSLRFQEIKDQINAIDSQRPRPDIWDIEHEKLRGELKQIHTEADALLNAGQTDDDLHS